MTVQPLTFHRYPIQIPWACDRRGDCCTKFSSVGMSVQERETILAAISPDVAATLRWRDDATPGFVQLRAKPCPLLTSDGLCSVYAVRPFNCARFNCYRVGDEPWESNPDGSCRNLTARLAQSREVRRDYAKNQRKAQRRARKNGWVD